MRIAMLADLHGNMVATQAVWDHLQTQRIDQVYCLGDLVGKGPSPVETMDWAMAHCDVVLRGNWDEGVVNTAFACNTWMHALLGKERLQTLITLPLEHRFRFSGRNIRLIHGRPVVPDTVFTSSPIEERRAMFETGDAYRPDVVGFADIHQPFYQQVQGYGILFNTGSVGNPLAGQPWPSYAIMEGEMGEDTASFSITFMQVDYDRRAAVQAVEEAAKSGMHRPDLFITEVETGIYSRMGKNPAIKADKKV